MNAPLSDKSAGCFLHIAGTTPRILRFSISCKSLVKARLGPLRGKLVTGLKSGAGGQFSGQARAQGGEFFEANGELPRAAVNLLGDRSDRICSRESCRGHDGCEPGEWSRAFKERDAIGPDHRNPKPHVVLLQAKAKNRVAVRCEPIMDRGTGAYSFGDGMSRVKLNRGTWRIGSRGCAGARRNEHTEKNKRQQCRKDAKQGM